MPACVRGPRHGAAERVDLLDQVALADAADGRVAAHLPERLDVVRQQQRAAPHARGGQRRFGAGMAAADHDHVELGLKAHHSESTGSLFRKGAYSKPRRKTARTAHGRAGRLGNAGARSRKTGNQPRCQTTNSRMRTLILDDSQRSRSWAFSWRGRPRRPPMNPRSANPPPISAPSTARAICAISPTIAARWWCWNGPTRSVRTPASTTERQHAKPATLARDKASSG